jgi:hypothetical protein
MNVAMVDPKDRFALDPAVLLADAEETTIFQDVTRALMEKTRDDPFDRDRAERDRDWNFLRTKVVGFEFD